MLRNTSPTRTAWEAAAALPAAPTSELLNPKPYLGSPKAIDVKVAWGLKF